MRSVGMFLSVSACYCQQHHGRIFNRSSRNLAYSFRVPKGRTDYVGTGMWKYLPLFLPL